MSFFRRKVLGLTLAAALLVFAVQALAAEELKISGQVLGPEGSGRAGAIVSDGFKAVASGENGRFTLTSQAGRIVSFTAPAGFLPQGRYWWPAEDAAGQGLDLRLIAAPEKAEPVVALLSDPHLFSPSVPTGYHVAPEIAQRPLKAWRNIAERLQKQPPALTVVSGDLCANGDYAAMDHARAQMALAAKSLDLLPRPARALPGNHDVRYMKGTEKGVYLDLWRRHLGPARQVFLLRQAAFILIDNLGQSRTIKDKQRSCGRTPAMVISWLKDVLSLTPPDLPVVLVSHYPLLSPLSGNNPLSEKALVQAPGQAGLALRNTDQSATAILKLLSKKKLLALINGHEHAYCHSRLYFASGELQVLGLPAVCGGWWQGNRPWRSQSFPPGYVMARIIPGKDGPQLTHRFEKVTWD